MPRGMSRSFELSSRCADAAAPYKEGRLKGADNGEGETDESISCWTNAQEGSMTRQVTVTVMIQPRPNTPGMVVAKQDTRITCFGSVTRAIEKTDYYADNYPVSGENTHQQHVGCIF